MPRRASAAAAAAPAPAAIPEKPDKPKKPKPPKQLQDAAENERRAAQHAAAVKAWESKAASSISRKVGTLAITLVEPNRAWCVMSDESTA